MELCRRLGEKLQQGWSLDQALQDCVEGSAWLNSLLQLRPRMPVPSSDYAKKHKSMDAPSASASKGKGKGKRLRSTGSCFQFQSGKCSRGAECRFKHTCDQCGKESWSLPMPGSD